MTSVERMVIRQEDRQERAIKDAYENADARFEDDSLDAMLCITLRGNHSGERIHNRCANTFAGASKVMQEFFREASTDVIFELVTALQECGAVGIRYEGYAFVLKAWYFDSVRWERRTSLVKCLTVFDEFEHNFKFKNVAGVFTVSHVYDAEGNVLV